MDWRVHTAAVLDDLRPEGYLEETIAERIAFLLWRLGRVARYEREATAVALENAENDMDRSNYDEIGPLPNARARAQVARECLDIVTDLDELPEDETIDAILAATLLEETAEDVGVDLDTGEVSFPGYPDGKDLDDVHWTAGLLRNCLTVIAEAGGMTPAEQREAMVTAYTGRLRSAEQSVKDQEAKLDQYRRQRILPDRPELEKVNRYETTIERSLYKALHELQRLQTIRKSRAPVPVDVALDGQSQEE